MMILLDRGGGIHYDGKKGDKCSLGSFMSIMIWEIDGKSRGNWLFKARKVVIEPKVMAIEKIEKQKEK